MYQTGYQILHDFWPMGLFCNNKFQDFTGPAHTSFTPDISSYFSWISWDLQGKEWKEEPY